MRQRLRSIALVTLLLVGLVPVSTLACEFSCEAGEASMHHQHGMDHAAMAHAACADGPVVAATQPPCVHGVTSMVSTTAVPSGQAAIAPVALPVAVIALAPPPSGRVAPKTSPTSSPPGSPPALFALRI